MNTQEANINGTMIGQGTILINNDARANHPEVRVETVYGTVLTVRNTVTGRKSTLSLDRLRSTLGQANGFNIGI